jgi:hypothetical protein
MEHMNMVLSDGTYPATLRDKENQILSDGEARFNIKLRRGVFWPQEPINEDLILKSATAVQTSKGHTAAILKIKRCPAEFPPAVHFDFEF